MIEVEEWLAVPEFEDFYEASTFGRIRSIDRLIEQAGYTRMMRGRMLRPSRRDDGYYAFKLRRATSALLHQVICTTFHGARPDDSSVVRHLDGDKDNNRPDNLAWGTQTENNLDCVRHRTHAQTRKTHCKHGHEFTESNTYKRVRNGRPTRECIGCMRARTRIRGKS